MAYDGAGKQLWSSTPKDHDGVRIVTVRAEPGALFAAGEHTTSGGQRLWVTRRDSEGGALWSWSHEPLKGGDMQLCHDAVVRALDGGYHICTTLYEQGTTPNRPSLVRIGPWGELDCTKTGKCAASKLADCDDGKACTADLCQPDKGCVHKPLSVAGCGG